MSDADLIAGIAEPGRFDATVDTEETAKRIVRAAMPAALELEPAVCDPYPSPPGGVKTWFQSHPAEPAAGNPLPHVKYADWSRGKKGRGGSWGHVYFPPPGT